MSFSGIISLNHNDPILLLMKYVPYNFYITSKYIVLGSLKYHKIKNESETLHILYRGSLPLDIFESFDNFCLLNQKLSGREYCMVIIKCMGDIPKEVYLSTDEYGNKTLNFHVSKNKVLFPSFMISLGKLDSYEEPISTYIFSPLSVLSKNFLITC